MNAVNASIALSVSTSKLQSQTKFLMDPGVHALQVLDVILMKDSTSKMTFYHNLPQVMNEIPKVSVNISFCKTCIIACRLKSGLNDVLS